MKKLFAILGLLVSFHVAHARSLHPCTPRVKAKPTIISCVQDDLYFDIRVNVLMSDARICPFEQWVEHKTANVTVSDGKGNVSEKFSIANGKFSYTLSPVGDSTFKSESRGLDLKDCVTPMMGGFSIGN